MGVKKLWGILKPVCKKEPLENMRGKTLCVDLSTWICQAEETMFLKTAVAKPYLRNTIFRVLCLKRLGTQLIFVTEGTPPQLKYDVILERARARKEAEENGGLKFSRGRGTRRAGNDAGKRDKSTESASSKPKKVGRSLFQRKINECAQLLRLMGIPVVKSEGEAEACCALLNKEKIADGVITEDGDTFLYGGEVVYKNLGISSKDPHVYSYSMQDIQNELELDRNGMIALGLLLGCDYTDGVPGVGKLTALKLLKEFHGNADLLERFKVWVEENKCPESASSIEKQVFRKAMQVNGFPNEEVINEFLIPRDEIEAIRPQIIWSYPDLVNVQRFCFKHMEWPEEYTLSKILGVATNEFLRRIPRGIPIDSPLTATRLVKSRMQHGVPLCEVEWKTDCEKAVGIWRGYPTEFVTLESQQSILAALPSLVEEFEMAKSKKKKEGKKKPKTHKMTSEQANEGGDSHDVIEQSRNDRPITDIEDDDVRGEDIDHRSLPRLASLQKHSTGNQPSSEDHILNDVVSSLSKLEIDHAEDNSSSSRSLINDAEEDSVFQAKATSTDEYKLTNGDNSSGKKIKVPSLRERLANRLTKNSKSSNRSHSTLMNQQLLTNGVSTKMSTDSQSIKVYAKAIHEEITKDAIQLGSNTPVKDSFKGVLSTDAEETSSLQETDENKSYETSGKSTCTGSNASFIDLSREVSFPNDFKRSSNGEPQRATGDSVCLGLNSNLKDGASTNLIDEDSIERLRIEGCSNGDENDNYDDDDVCLPSYTPVKYSVNSERRSHLYEDADYEEEDSHIRNVPHLCPDTPLKASSERNWPNDVAEKSYLREVDINSDQSLIKDSFDDSVLASLLQNISLDDNTNDMEKIPFSPGVMTSKVEQNLSRQPRSRIDYCSGNDGRRDSKVVPNIGHKSHSVIKGITYKDNSKQSQLTPNINHQSKTTSELYTSTDDFNFDSTFDLSIESDVCLISPDRFENKENSDVFEAPFDNETYLEKLRKKLDIVDAEAYVRSPLRTIESPNVQPDDCEDQTAPVSFMERIRLRSQKL